MDKRRSCANYSSTDHHVSKVCIKARLFSEAEARRKEKPQEDACGNGGDT